MTGLEIVAIGLCLVAAGLSGLRWLRVAQREHYLAASASRFAWRWWALGALNPLLGLVALADVVVAVRYAPCALLTAAAVALGPVGLGLQGRTSKLAWTNRLRRVALTAALLVVAVVAIGAGLFGLHGATVAAAAGALAVPVLVDVALAVMRPVEARFAKAYVDQASEILRRVSPRVVAITGSYGKTSTKGYVAHLLSSRLTVLASPRSYNNQAGLTRTVNEHLVAGTDVLVAEMGTYGPGEIAAMCAWMQPEVSVMTAIGPVHLERFGSLEVTLAAKREITVGARAVVLNVDDPRLAGLATELRAGGQSVVGASATDTNADVALVREDESLVLYERGARIGPVSLGPDEDRIALTNVACALGVAMTFGIETASLLELLATLPRTENRLQPRVGTSGVLILDDTFNSNPSGCVLALSALAATGEPERRKMVVTPGMVELGALQNAENAAFAEAAVGIATDLVIVNRTNRRALLQGVEQAREGGATVNVYLVDHREEAVELVRSKLGPGDVVLYENDLPDHFP